MTVAPLELHGIAVGTLVHTDREIFAVKQQEPGANIFQKLRACSAVGKGAEQKERHMRSKAQV